MINRMEVERLAALSRIALTGAEAERIGDDIEKIISYVSEIREAGVEVRPNPETGAVYNVLREDGEAHESGIYSDCLLSQTPKNEGLYIKVKKIL